MRILLVKLSSLGDVVHTLPVLQDIRAAMPQAQIDWVVEKAFAPLLSQVKGLHRIIPCELRRWRQSFWTAQTRQAWRAFQADLQRDPYDAVIDLQGLTKSAVVARLAKLTGRGKRFAMANQTDGSGYEAPTRWVADETIVLAPHSHAVQRGRDMAAGALGYRVHKPLDFGFNDTSNRPLAQSLLGQEAPENIAFIHGTSRLDKAWPIQNWAALGQRLVLGGQRVVLVHGSAAELAVSQTIAAQLGRSAVVFPLLPIDALTQALAACQGAIGVDSGVSHIAVALGLAHVQIYNFDTAWRTGPPVCAHQTSVFASGSPTVDAVWQAWLRCEKALQ